MMRPLDRRAASSQISVEVQLSILTGKWCPCCSTVPTGRSGMTPRVTASLTSGQVMS